ncbi:divergent polysaccharide deacetylase family protein [Oleidesulfovibrio sp.]|uniref:divergent polysaccharide deacetylase family protein n=1 Tax=Oleidesulfovibrio sp. TaxID=2909707 RepID=UPI003A8A5747
MTMPSEPSGKGTTPFKRILRKISAVAGRAEAGKESDRKGFFTSRLFLGLVAFACGVLLTGSMMLVYFSMTRTEPDSRIAEKTATGEALPSVRDLLDPSSLPYEEALGGSLEQAVKQVDYALLRTLERLELSRRSLLLESVEVRSQKGEEYHFQRLGVAVDGLRERFISGLRTALATWAPSANLRKGQDDVYRVIIEGVPTHELSFLPLRDEQIADGEDGIPAQAENTTKPAMPDSAERPIAGEQGIQPPPVGVAPQPLPAGAPRLAIVIDDIGESMRAVERLTKLDYLVTLAIWPRSSHARRAAEYGWKQGREIMVHQPMEPLGYPKVNPGPGALFVTMNADQIHTVLAENLKMVPHAVGINNHMGSRFTQNKVGVKAVLSELYGRNMFVLDSVTHGGSVLYNEAVASGLPAYRRSVFLDVVRDKKSIVHQLEKAARIAQREGSAIAIGHPTAETLAALEEWQRIRNRNVRIVSVMGLDKVVQDRQ